MKKLEKLKTKEKLKIKADVATTEWFRCCTATKIAMFNLRMAQSKVDLLLLEESKSLHAMNKAERALEEAEGRK